MIVLFMSMCEFWWQVPASTQVCQPIDKCQWYHIVSAFRQRSPFLAVGGEKIRIPDFYRVHLAYCSASMLAGAPAAQKNFPHRLPLIKETSLKPLTGRKDCKQDEIYLFLLWIFDPWKFWVWVYALLEKLPLVWMGWNLCLQREYNRKERLNATSSGWLLSITPLNLIY